MIKTLYFKRMFIIGAAGLGTIICLFSLSLLSSGRLALELRGMMWVYYPLYLILSIGLSIFVYYSLPFKSNRISFERKIRVAFILSAILVIFSNVYSQIDFISLSLCGIGIFIGVLVITWPMTGLVELIPPPPSIKNMVEEKHHVTLGELPRGSLSKRTFDISFSLLGLILSSPLWILLSFLIWFEDPGPLFFSKICVTKSGKSFRQLKFRSMVKEAEKQTGPILASQVDPRITYIGKLIRKTGMDELPQFLNILKGEMSFVGPRPQRTVLVYEYIKNFPEYVYRHAVQPGLTGLAQVFGHYYVRPGQKLRYDLLYVRNAGLWLDLKLFTVSFLISFSGGWQNQRGRGILLCNRHGLRRQTNKWPPSRLFSNLKGEGT